MGIMVDFPLSGILVIIQTIDSDRYVMTCKRYKVLCSSISFIESYLNYSEIIEIERKSFEKYSTTFWNSIMNLSIWNYLKF